MTAPSRHCRYRQRGLSLIELMVALAIGLFLIVGALTVFVQSQSTSQVNDSIARLQENGRYFFDVVEPDIRMARHWGLTTRSSLVAGRAAPNDPVSPLAPANDCGPNWTVNLDEAVTGSNNTYGFTCPPFGYVAPGADTLVVRRAAVTPVDRPEENALYIVSSRAAGATLFRGPTIPGTPDSESSEIRELIVSGYYVSRNSSLDSAGNAVPSLRRKRLRNGGAGGPVVVDEEVLPGVEDMQIEFGVDSDREGDAGYGSVDRYLDPDDPVFDHSHPAYNEHARVLAVRVWLRLRSERPDSGLSENTGFSYADRNTGALNDGFRRIVVSKTIFLRNASTAT